MNRITVLYPIRVPSGKYCWKYTSPHELCEHYDNEGGNPRCDLGFYVTQIDDGGAIKPEECLNLKVE